MAESLICPKCKAVNPLDAKFCNVCGEPLNASPDSNIQNKPGGMSLAEQRAMYAQANKANSENNKTVNAQAAETSSSELKKAPVAGWIVCTKGEGRGNDYRIRSGNNRIGNTSSSEICLADNKAVATDNFATIAYYTKQNAYYVMPGDSDGKVRINGEDVEIPTPLKSGATLMIGGSEYKFIPLCTEDFKWEGNDNE